MSCRLRNVATDRAGRILVAALRHSLLHDGFVTLVVWEARFVWFGDLQRGPD